MSEWVEIQTNCGRTTAQVMSLPCCSLVGSLKRIARHEVRHLGHVVLYLFYHLLRECVQLSAKRPTTVTILYQTARTGSSRSPSQASRFVRKVDCVSRWHLSSPERVDGSSLHRASFAPFDASVLKDHPSGLKRRIIMLLACDTRIRGRTAKVIRSSQCKKCAVFDASS